MLAAWDWRDGKLTQRWMFDSDDGTPGNRAYRGQGNHGLSVGDVDGDGKDEIIYGSCVIGGDGKGLYSTGLGHGDAMHFSDLDPDRPGLEVFKANGDAANKAGIQLRDARTGEQIWGVASTGTAGRRPGVRAGHRPAAPRGWRCGARARASAGCSTRRARRSPTPPRGCATWASGGTATCSASCSTA